MATATRYTHGERGRPDSDPFVTMHYIQIFTRGPAMPRDPRDALYQFKYWPIVVWITQTDRVSAWEALSATATFYSATCIVLYMHRCTRHKYRTASMQCRACHQQTSVQPISLMSTGPLLWSTNVDYHQCRLWHRQRTIVDANHSGEWTERLQTPKVTFKVIKCHP